MDLYRVRVALNGGAGGAKVSTFYSDGTTGFQAVLTDFYTAIKGYLPNQQVVDVAADGDIIDSETGLITSSWTTTPNVGVTGTGGPSYPAGVGACVTWRTAAVIEGKRVRGRTFIVPLTTAAYDQDGTLIAECLTALRAASADVVASGQFYVFSRPRLSPVLPGSAVPFTASTVTDKVAYLSSRRD